MVLVTRTNIKEVAKLAPEYTLEKLQRELTNAIVANEPLYVQVPLPKHLR